MTTRLVAFLGMGPLKSDAPHYEPVFYRFGDRTTAAKTPVMAGAVVELLDPVDAVLVLGTEDVRKRWVDTGLLGTYLRARWSFREVKAGRTPEECWALFDAVRDALRPEALPELGETAAPTRILADLTHGFRAQPILGTAALGYVLSEWRRSSLATPPSLTLLYGAYEAREGDVAPLWDLTGFVSATQWNQSLDALMRYGRADDLEALGRLESAARVEAARRSGVTGAALGEHGVAKRFGALARAFADDLALARFPHLLTGVRPAQKQNARAEGSAQKLLGFLDSPEAASLAAQLPVLRDSLSRLRGWLSPLRAARLESPEGVRALAALARLCGQLQRYSEQIAAVREGLVSLHALEAGAPVAAEAGASGYRDARLAAERALNEAAGGDAADVFGRTAQPRNDVHHGGLNDQPLEASKLREQIEGLSARFAALAARGQSRGEG